MQRHYLTCAPPYRCYRARLRCWQMTYARRFHFYIYKMERLYMYNLPVYLFCACISMLSCFSHVQFFATPWTVVHQASLSMEFSSQEYWNGLPFPSPGNLLDPGTEPRSLIRRFFTTEPPEKPPKCNTPDLIRQSSIIRRP